jgi:uncharacterized protein YndB with AHSA1/START domain
MSSAVNTVNTDAIVKKVLLRAPRSRVWRALTDVQEFNAWFGVALSGAAAPGARLRGPVRMKGYEHLTLDMTIERVEPERVFSWRWHPSATDPSTDYSAEPTTLVTFELEEVPDGTMLTVVESGFDRIPAARRADAYRGNEGGWTYQMDAINRYVSATP